jgi:hypothetical protein
MKHKQLVITTGAGYNQVIKFDKRFSSQTPPYFPAYQELTRLYPGMNNFGI